MAFKSKDFWLLWGENPVQVPSVPSESCGATVRALADLPRTRQGELAVLRFGGLRADKKHYDEPSCVELHFHKDAGTFHSPWRGGYSHTRAPGVRNM